MIEVDGLEAESLQTVAKTLDDPRLEYEPVARSRKREPLRCEAGLSAQAEIEER